MAHWLTIGISVLIIWFIAFILYRITSTTGARYLIWLLAILLPVLIYIFFH
ncbi:hypothetical protein [Loigolactobacillus iwatensis]|uniref:hypothetical protein n=1 Tax=Loigolactobacillus iwatensis TaxID=1267156 RepID=UPI0013DE19C8|nr:hypothetical protein [Loigolactobacillus iwatensis]